MLQPPRRKETCTIQPSGRASCLPSHRVTSSAHSAVRRLALKRGCQGSTVIIPICSIMSRSRTGYRVNLVHKPKCAASRPAQRAAATAQRAAAHLFMQRSGAVVCCFLDQFLSRRCLPVKHIKSSHRFKPERPGHWLLGPTKPPAALPQPPSAAAAPCRLPACRSLLPTPAPHPPPLAAADERVLARRPFSHREWLRMGGRSARTWARQSARCCPAPAGTPTRCSLARRCTWMATGELPGGGGGASSAPSDQPPAKSSRVLAAETRLAARHPLPPASLPRLLPVTFNAPGRPPLAFRLAGDPAQAPVLLIAHVLAGGAARE